MRRPNLSLGHWPGLAMCTHAPNRESCIQSFEHRSGIMSILQMYETVGSIADISIQPQRFERQMWGCAPGQDDKRTHQQQSKRRRMGTCRDVTASVEPAEVVRRCRVRAKQGEVAALKLQLHKVGGLTEKSVWLRRALL